MGSPIICRVALSYSYNFVLLLIFSQRYYGVTIVDGYGIIIKVICPRTREGSWEADQYVIVGPGFTGSLPSHFDDDHIIQSLSRFIFIISRNEVHGSDDVPNVRAIQNGYTLASLDGNELPKITPLVFPYVVSEELAKPTPEPQIFFSHANFIINSMAIEGSESDLFKRFAKIEVGPATEFIGQRMSQPMYRNIQDGIANGSESIVDAHAADIAKVRNGWITLLESQVVHTDYLGRAVNAMFAGLYISDPEEAMFHSGSEDIDGHALDSTKYDYMLTFAPGQFPPVAEQYGGFWSVTVYLGPGWGPQRKLGSLVHNPIDRYAVNGRTTPGLVYDANGALTLYIQKTRPDTDAKAANWLPTPDPEFGGYETGEFHLLLRAYVPEDIEYIPPAIVKIGPATSIRNMHIP